MILTCPSCATSYFVSDEAIGANGRSVRCKACAHNWRASLEEPLELSEAPPEPAAANAAVSEAMSGWRTESLTESLAETPAPELPRAYRAKVEQQRRLRRAAAHGVVWAGVAAGFALLIGAAWLFRVEVVEMAPRTAAAYAAVGLKVNPTGLEFEALSGRALPNDPGKVVISGALRNVRDNERVAPPVRVALLDAHGAEIGHAVIRIDAAPVLPGKVQGFAAVIDDPGGKGQGVGVDFVLTPQAPSEARTAPATPAPAHRPLPTADVGGLRPALSPGPSAPLNMQPIDAVPEASAVVADASLDSSRSGALSTPHG